MFKVNYIEKGREIDFRRIDREKQIIANSYFTSGGLYYFRLNEFNYSVIAKEDVLQIEEIKG